MIPTPLGDASLSSFAQRRMAERGITEDEVREALNNPDASYYAGPHTIYTYTHPRRPVTFKVRIGPGSTSGLEVIDVIRLRN